MANLPQNPDKQVIKEWRQILDKRVIIAFKGDKLKTLAEVAHKLFMTQEATFVVKDGEVSTQEQCRAKAFRTIEDFYLVSKYYFPRIRLTTCINAANRLRDEGLLYVQLCNQIKQYVHNHKKAIVTLKEVEDSLKELNIKKYERPERKTTAGHGVKAKAIPRRT